MATKMEVKFKEYIAKPKRAVARELMDNEIVDCYNGKRIGQKGDFVVIDEQDRVMIIKRDKFKNNYMENIGDEDY
jgi:hypothetical protein